ncbi:MAG: hypothetical protein ACFFBM_09415 [Promethearchaeota archaeon]
MTQVEVERMEVKHLPLVIALSCLWISLFALFVAILAMNSGHMIYTIDDIYIHLAISRNLNEFSVFGVTRYEFSSSSSSPLWDLIISAGFLLVGVNDMLPLALNAILASIAVVTVYVLLKDTDMSPRYITGVLLSFVFFTSLPGLVFTGMEHILQIILSLIFVVLSSRVLSGDVRFGKESFLLFIVTPFVSAIRFESIFLVIPVVVLFLMKREWTHALIVLGMTAVPWIVYGIVSVQNGWLFLPNSLIVKGIDAVHYGIGWFLVRGIANLVISPYLLGLLIASVKLSRFQEQGFWHSDNVMMLIFVSACLMHLQFGSIGWFFRYEAYLVALGVFTVAVRGRRFLSGLNIGSLSASTMQTGPKRTRLYAYGLIILFIAPLLARGALCIAWTPIASNNIYNQHYQIALFLDRFYTGETVMMNDIGCANFLSDIVCIDKWGIGTLDIGTSWLDGSISVDTIRIAAANHGVEIAIIYIDGLVPEEWEIVGYWTIRNNVAAYNSTVAFLAVMPSERDRLIANLIQFSSVLSEDVIESGLYTTIS